MRLSKNHPAILLRLSPVMTPYTCLHLIAFIVAGCTYMTYYKTLKHAIGIKAVQWCDFQSTIEMMYPIVKLMVDRMCGDAKLDDVVQIAPNSVDRLVL